MADVAGQHAFCKHCGGNDDVRGMLPQDAPLHDVRERRPRSSKVTPFPARDLANGYSASVGADDHLQEMVVVAGDVDAPATVAVG